MTWQNIIPLLIAAILGFLLKILHGKIFEKKVRLYFELDRPAIFSVIPPTVCFQNIRIFNKGNLPSHSIKISLNRQIIDEFKVMYKAGDEEPYDEERNEKVLVLKFAQLLPTEELTISFKSERPIPRDFLLSVKSDEMIARNIASEKKPDEWLRLMTTAIALLVAAAATFIVTPVFKFKSSQSPTVVEKQDIPAPFLLKLMTDKNIYTSGQNIQVIYQFTNTSNEILKDILFSLDIPGIELDYKTIYQKKNYIKSGEQVTYNRVILIPSDLPTGKYKASLSVSAKGLEKFLRDESFAYFQVQ